MSQHILYTTESRCLINNTTFKAYNDPTDGYFPNLRIECTNDIYIVLKAHNIPALEYLDCFMTHGLAKVKPWNICSTDFGAPGINLTLNQVNEYLASKACFFFQYILSGTTIALGGASKFTDCLDKRHSHGTCVTDEDNDGCTDEKTCN